MNLELTTYKNYKELCCAIDWKPRSGNTKISQLKELERYCTYEREGNKYIIKEIYDKPLPKPENKRNSIYLDCIEKLIVHMLSSCPIDRKTKSINMSRNGLYLKLHMINKNYNTGRNNINRFSRYLQVPITCIYDFYNNTGAKLRDNVERTLNRLQSKCLIHWEYRIGVKIRTGAHRLATDYEINEIIKSERNILKQMKAESKKDIFLNGKWNDFRSKVSEDVRENTSIDYYYKVFHVNTTPDFTEMLLEADDLDSIQNELNATVYFSTIETSKKHFKRMQEKWKIHSFGKGTYFKKPKYENEQVALRQQYIEDTKKIAEKVIEWDTYDLDLSEISNEKYTLMEAMCDESGSDGGLLFFDDALKGFFG